MRGPTAIFFLSSVWTLLFAASRFHHVAATTPSPPFFPQVRTVLPSPVHMIFNALQGFFFDWNPSGTTVPIPVTRTVEFSCGALLVLLIATTEQCETLHITWQRGSTGVGWVLIRFSCEGLYSCASLDQILPLLITSKSSPRASFT